MALLTPPGGENPSAAFLAGVQHGAALAVQHHAAPPKTKPVKAAPTKAKAPAKSTATPLNTYLAQARAAAAADINPQITAIKNQQAQYNQTAAQKAAMIQGLYQAAANMMQGVGDQTAKSYQTAAQSLGGLAQGFSGQTGADAQSAAAQLQQQLAGLGAPAGAAKTATGETSNPQALQNVLYGLGGWIPGNLMLTSGEAMAAAQRQLPGTTLASGGQQMQAALNEGASQAEQLNAQIDQIKAGQPKLVQQYLTNIQEQIRQDALANSLMGSRTASQQATAARIKLDQQNLQFRKDQAAFNNKIKEANLNLAQWKAAHPNMAAGSKPSASMTNTINDGYLHNADGTRSIVNGKPVPVQKNESKPTVTTTKNAAKALGYARNYHGTWKDKNGARAPLRWSQYLTACLTAGIDLKIAMAAGRKVYTPDEIRNDSQPPWSPGTKP